MSQFYKYFKENMEALGLPAPESLFGNLQAAVSSVSAIMAYVDKFGSRVTVRELIVAGTRLEVLGTIGACSVAYYLGAVIGSLAVATGRSLAGGTSLSDVMFTARKYGWARPWLSANLYRWPGIYNNKVASRSSSRSFASMV